MSSNRDISILVGKTLTKVERQGQDEDDAIVFHCADNTKYRLFHVQDCCETVYIEDINGDLQDLIGKPILDASERTSDTDPDGRPALEYKETERWTFYRISTIAGTVVIRWYGSSDYYSIGVSFAEVS